LESNWIGKKQKIFSLLSVLFFVHSLFSGTILKSDIICSNATPYHTIIELLSPVAKSLLPSTFQTHINNVEYRSDCMKINIAVNKLPNFICMPNSKENQPAKQHYGKCKEGRV